MDHRSRSKCGADDVRHASHERRPRFTSNVLRRGDVIVTVDPSAADYVPMLDGYPSAAGISEREHERPVAKPPIGTTCALLDAAPKRRPARSKRAIGTLADWQYRRALAFIWNNSHRPIHLCEISILTGLSVSQFGRAFKRSSGRSPYSYLLLVRLVRAKELMRVSDDRLSDVAISCGFADQSHMTRLFRSRVGVTPGSWRKLHRIT